MKILSVNASIDPVAGGGTAERTVQLSRAWSLLGAEVTILTLDVGLTAARMAELDRVKVVSWPLLSRRFYLPIPKVGQLMSLVKATDVIHLMGHWTVLNVMVFLCAKWVGKRYVVCPAGALPIFGRSKFLKQFFNRLVGTRLIRLANAHVAVANNEYPGFAAYGVPAEKISLIPNGIDLQNTFPVDDVLSVPTPYVLFLGRLNPIKGPDILLDAFIAFNQENPSVHCVFAGPDEGLKESLIKTTKAAGLEGFVHFEGGVTGVQKNTLLKNACVLVIPSRKEAMSIVILEAGILGTPVLATDECGLQNFDNNRLCTIVPARSKEIAEALCTLLANPDYLKEQGIALKAFITSHYSWRTIAEKYLALFEKVIT